MIEEGTALIEDDLEDNPGTNDIVNNDTTHDVEPGIPNELKSDLGSYWVLEESSYAHVLSTKSNNNIEASKSTP